MGIAGESVSAYAQEPAAMVFINGKPFPVFFNDGDSFRVLSGGRKGQKARLAGFNTLESHGPAHQWGDWTAKELYVMAKTATLHARRGVWNCTTDEKTDTYGRALFWCPDLALDLVKHGFAHVMSVDDVPALPKLLEAQQEAIAHRRGIWAHGVPDLVLTSLHSVEEDLEGKGTYNRLVSTKDGHSIKWKHTNRYEECQTVCHKVYEVSDDVIDAAVIALRDDPELGAVARTLSNKDLIDVVTTFARYRVVDRPIRKEHFDAVRLKLEAWASDGKFGTSQGTDGACMIHVRFERRYGGTRAACLK